MCHTSGDTHTRMHHITPSLNRNLVEVLSAWTTEKTLPLVQRHVPADVCLVYAGAPCGGLTVLVSLLVTSVSSVVN